MSTEGNGWIRWLKDRKETLIIGVGRTEVGHGCDSSFFFYIEEMCLWVWRACLFTYTRSLLGCKCKYTGTTVFSGNPFPLYSKPPVLYKKANKIPPLTEQI